MSVLFSARHVTRFLTNLVAIAAVSVIFAAKAMDAGLEAEEAPVVADASRVVAAAPSQ